MKVINLFDSKNQQYWLTQIKKSDWVAGKYLYEIITNNTFFNEAGIGAKVLLLTKGKALISFCTYAQKDNIPNDDLTPWVGFVYTFPKYRGNRYIGLLFDEVQELAQLSNIKRVYLSTDHVGLYEKYGFNYLMQHIDLDNELARIYVKEIK